MPTRTGIAANELTDADLERELIRLHETRHETLQNGSADALQAHTERMIELEQEYLQRFPDRAAPAPRRTREGSRAAATENGTQPPAV